MSPLSSTKYRVKFAYISDTTGIVTTEVRHFHGWTNTDVNDLKTLLSITQTIENELYREGDTFSPAARIISMRAV